MVEVKLVWGLTALADSRTAGRRDRRKLLVGCVVDLVSRLAQRVVLITCVLVLYLVVVSLVLTVARLACVLPIVQLATA